MKNVYLMIFGVLLMLSPAGPVQAEDGTAAMKRLGNEVSALKLGFNDYILGRQLTEQQKLIAKKKAIEKTIDGSYKFSDGGVFVVASIDTDMVIGLYKQNAEASQQDVKAMVGELMMRFEEPTTVAHDKLIYWAFGKEGRISQDVFDLARQSGGEDVLATVKFSSDQPILSSPKTEEENQTVEAVENKESSIYVIISSNPLSKIFLAQNK